MAGRVTLRISLQNETTVRRSIWKISKDKNVLAGSFKTKKIFQVAFSSSAVGYLRPSLLGDLSSFALFATKTESTLRGFHFNFPAAATNFCPTKWVKSSNLKKSLIYLDKNKNPTIKKALIYSKKK